MNNFCLYFFSLALTQKRAHICDENPLQINSVLLVKGKKYSLKFFKYSHSHDIFPWTSQRKKMHCQCFRSLFTLAKIISSEKILFIFLQKKPFDKFSLYISTLESSCTFLTKISYKKVFHITPVKANNSLLQSAKREGKISIKWKFVIF